MVTLLTILVVIGMFATLATLFVGMAGMVRGSEDTHRANALMRWRVTIQGVTLVLFALLLYVSRG
ncbi:twin transmembrane helix small protein [Muricoccus pecuniae]|uniref:Type II secretory pathway pseudopilin PulG n=1 Tax=Muricoccus pecuniae TaxID=693023 RepID=A0A840Y2G6_9PROT|nr:twin transmembrane helix small protein [Roseomonas pecuniae]MBB5694336.1 type II secretory pathway pseudopilin PulG [Roseomonas pecuniae]